jgi:hypothetical protein
LYDWPYWNFHCRIGEFFLSFELPSSCNNCNQKKALMSFFAEEFIHCGFVAFQILNKGILQLIGVEIGKGLDLPL